MEGLVPFAAAMGLIVVLELGDKTQLATISLASRHAWLPTFLGAASGLVLVTAVGAAAGFVLAEVLQQWIVAIQVGGEFLFVGFGVWTELREKTQIAMIILTASTAAPVSVFAGASIALAAVAAASAVVGSALARVLRADRTRIASALLFVVAGVLLIVEALLPG